MKAYELINWLNIRHPQKFAEEWDNVGLLVGDDQKEISHVFLALDLTEPVLDEAVAAGSGHDPYPSSHDLFRDQEDQQSYLYRKEDLTSDPEDIPYFAMLPIMM